MPALPGVAPARCVAKHIPSIGRHWSLDIFEFPLAFLRRTLRWKLCRASRTSQPSRQRKECSPSSVRAIECLLERRSPSRLKPDFIIQGNGLSGGARGWRMQTSKWFTLLHEHRFPRSSLRDGVGDAIRIPAVSAQQTPTDPGRDCTGRRRFRRESDHADRGVTSWRLGKKCDPAYAGCYFG